MSSNKVSVKQVMTLEQVADYLEDLAISLRKGTVVVQKDGGVVRFDPPETDRKSTRLNSSHYS